jgi:hypothetical protein
MPLTRLLSCSSNTITQLRYVFYYLDNGNQRQHNFNLVQTGRGTRKDEEQQEEKTRRDDIMRQARLDRLSLSLCISLSLSLSFSLPFARSLWELKGTIVLRCHQSNGVFKEKQLQCHCVEHYRHSSERRQFAMVLIVAIRRGSLCLLYYLYSTPTPLSNMSIRLSPSFIYYRIEWNLVLSPPTASNNGVGRNLPS